MERFSPLEFSKITGLGRKALRLYEAKGLLMPQKNMKGYRVYNQYQVQVAQKIVDYKRSGLSINEIKEALCNQNQVVLAGLIQTKIENKTLDLATSKLRLLAKEMEQELAKTVSEVQQFLQKNIREWDHRYQQYFDREVAVLGEQRVLGIFNGGLLIANFCKKNSWPMGPGRGATSASLILFGVGLHNINPVLESLTPERRVQNFQFHNDVDFNAGDDLFDLVRAINDQSQGTYQFTLFRMPILSIFKSLGGKNYFSLKTIEENNWETKFWKELSSGDFHYIFGLDEHNQSLVWRLYPEVMHSLDYNRELSHYLHMGCLSSFADWPMWCALFRLHKEELVERLKIGMGVLPQIEIPEEIQGDWRHILEKQKGLILFHEQSIELLAKFLDISLASASKLRVEFWKNKGCPEWEQATTNISPDLKSYFEQQIPHTFCLAHLKSWQELFRESAYWRTNFRDQYMQAIAEFSQSIHPLWGDFGVDLGKVKLLVG